MSRHNSPTPPLASIKIPAPRSSSPVQIRSGVLSPGVSQKAVRTNILTPSVSYGMLMPAGQTPSAASRAAASPSTKSMTIGLSPVPPTRCPPMSPAPARKPSANDVPLRFISASAARQHPEKRRRGFTYADAVAEAPHLLGVCDGVSGVQSLGLSPDQLPCELLSKCLKVMEERISRAGTGLLPAEGDGQWIMDVLKEAYDMTTSLGATTLLLAALEDSHRLVVANIGDCGLLLLRPMPYQSSRLSSEYRTVPLRYDMNHPVQIARLANISVDEVHFVISGATIDTVRCQVGDILVLGSDGIFDNLCDEDIARIVENHCIRTSCLEHAPASPALSQGSRPLPFVVEPAALLLEPQPPSAGQLRQAAEALVDAAIASVQAVGPEHAVGNADDTTALVAAVVEVDIDNQLEDLLPIGGRWGRRSSAKEASHWTAGFLPGCSIECCGSSVDRDDYEVSGSGDYVLEKRTEDASVPACSVS